METWGLIAIIVGVGIIVLLAIRELSCWYLKTNKILKLLERLMPEEKPEEEETVAPPHSP